MLTAMADAGWPPLGQAWSSALLPLSFSILPTVLRLLWPSVPREEVKTGIRCQPGVLQPLVHQARVRIGVSGSGFPIDRVHSCMPHLGSKLLTQCCLSSCDVILGPGGARVRKHFWGLVVEDQRRGGAWWLSRLSV